MCTESKEEKRKNLLKGMKPMVKRGPEARGGGGGNGERRGSQSSSSKFRGEGGKKIKTAEGIPPLTYLSLKRRVQNTSLYFYLFGGKNRL